MKKGMRVFCLNLVIGGFCVVGFSSAGGLLVGFLSAGFLSCGVLSVSLEKVLRALIHNKLYTIFNIV